MLFCARCKQLVPSTPNLNADGSTSYYCRECGSLIPLRRELQPGEVIGGFEIEQELGRGAMGIVYQARQTNLDREVAIKVLSDESASDEMYVERFFREARAAASLSHPCIVQAYDAGVTQDGIYYFVMEKITGENLDRVLSNVGPLNIVQALDVFLSVAGALSYAWAHNQLSHGDIKPENIIMRLNGKVKLADFGLARRAKDPELANEDIRATPAYAPPEIIRGDKNVPGFKSDMYSFGATAYHVLIGREPFVGTDPAKVCAMQLSELQDSLVSLNPNIPQRLSELVDRLMEKNPEYRPDSWDDVVSELNAIRAGIAAAVSAPPRVKKKFSILRRRHAVPLSLSSSARAAIIGACVLISALIGFGVFYLLRASGAPSRPLNPRPAAVSDAPSSGASWTDASESDSALVHDAIYYNARWNAIKSRFAPLDPDIETLSSFVSAAGALAPKDAVQMLDRCRVRAAAEQNMSDALILRNALLDEAAVFDRKTFEAMDAAGIAAFKQTLQTRIARLESLDRLLPQSLFLSEHRKTLDQYASKITSILAAKTNPSGAKTPVSAASGASAPAKTTTPEVDAPPPWMTDFKSVVSGLPAAVSSAQERVSLMKQIDELLARKDFDDAAARSNCTEARRFLAFAQAPLLPFLAADKSVLRGMYLFPNSFPDSKLDDISEQNIFRMKVESGPASITQKLSWNELRREEREERIVLTLVNCQAFPRLSQEFREYLYVRALFAGAKAESLRTHYDRASRLPEARRTALYDTTALFFPPPPAPSEPEESVINLDWLLEGQSSEAAASDGDEAAEKLPRLLKLGSEEASDSETEQTRRRSTRSGSGKTTRPL